ncbi:MAG: hypothetical protein LN568_03510 [Rickettsia endosymbiont of Pseudomimeciton antennatum]|nr:hypothetical protein [Rickettsia endosymbiont of Pseudomimeciton antennatum]MCC8398272.1 hypothetical protein [Rickettsia endosymbiont of Labidopullus appendiculatus]
MANKEKGKLEELHQELEKQIQQLKQVSQQSEQQSQELKEQTQEGDVAIYSPSVIAFRSGRSLQRFHC